MPLLSLESVRVRYGDREAVSGLSLEAARGECLGLLGPNGSGKSSTLAAAAGLIDPSGGTVRIDGLERREDRDRYARSVGFVPQEPALYAELSVEANLHFSGELYGLGGRDLTRRVRRWAGRLGLGGRLSSRVSDLSGGMQRRANFAAALLHEPALLLLDEPTAALDPESREALFAVVAELTDEGRAVVLTTHLLDEAEAHCDRVAALSAGRLVALGTPEELIRAESRERAVEGRLAEVVPAWREKAVRSLLPAGAALEIAGRRLRLTALGDRELGLALATLLRHGMELETFATPAAGLGHLLRAPAEGDRCAA